MSVSISASTQSTNKKHKVVVFDVDETLGNFAQFSIFLHVLDDYFKIPDVTYQHFNDLVDLYPEIIRPNMVRILDYIRKKKQPECVVKLLYIRIIWVLINGLRIFDDTLSIN